MVGFRSFRSKIFLTQRHKVAKRLAALQKLLRVLASWCETAVGSARVGAPGYNRTKISRLSAVCSLSKPQAAPSRIGGGFKGTTCPLSAGRAVGPETTTDSTDGTDGEDYFGSEGQTAPGSSPRATTTAEIISKARARRPQDVQAEDFFWIWTGFPAEITREFSGDAALRAIRVGLVSTSGRPRSGRTEKARVGFRAVQIPKKSPSSHLSAPSPFVPFASFVVERLPAAAR